MSEDRLDKALEAMKGEQATPEELARAHDSAWEKLGTGILCVEFERQIRGYLDGQLEVNHRLLMEDHLSRCPKCRAKLAEQRGDRKVAVMPDRRIARWPRWGTWAAAAALLLAALYAGRTQIETLLAPGGPRATVASVTGHLHRVPQGLLQAGAEIGDEEIIRTGPDSRAVLRLADGSTVEVNERSELSVHVTWRGKVVRLRRGDVIVQAARQHRGFLQVQTRDSLASVKGTIFSMSTGLAGSVVSVVEGSVAVSRAGSETVLSPGEQAASNPALASSVADAVSWSPDAETYLGILASLSHIETQLAQSPSPLLRTQSSLLERIPAQMVVYGAVPNFSGTVNQALQLAEQQAAENPFFGQWWNSGAGEELKRLIGRIQTMAPLFGDEIVYGMCAGPSGTGSMIPVLLAEVRQGKSAELKAALDSLGTGLAAPAYHLTDTLLAASNSTVNLQWLQDHMGGGAGTAFAGEIAARYRDGAAWLLGIDMDTIASLSGADRNEFVQTQRPKHLFLEQRSYQGTEENELTVSFNGPRTGLASVLAAGGSGGAAEYLTSGAIAAVYVSTREPQQLFQELTGLIDSSVGPSFQENLAEAEAKLGINFANDFAASVGTESAFGLEGFSTTGPVWVLAALVNDPATLEAFFGKLADQYNAHLAEGGQTPQISILHETLDGRTWTTMDLATTPPVSITWTYDSGYLVAGSSRAAVARALSTRNGGSSLVWSSAFQQQLPSSAGLHPSGFAWLNTKGAFEGLGSLVSNPLIQKLVAERDPILVALSGTTEQIRAFSRTRLSGMVVNMMLMQGLGRARAESQTAHP